MAHQLQLAVRANLEKKDSTNALGWTMGSFVTRATRKGNTNPSSSDS